MKTKSRVATISLLAGSLIVLLSPTMSFGADAKATPESVYNKYHQALVNAKTFEDVTPFLCAKGVKEMKETPAEEQPTPLFSFRGVLPQFSSSLHLKIFEKGNV